MVKPVIILGSAIGATAIAGVGYAGYQAVANGQPILQTLSNATDGTRGILSSMVGVVAPNYANHGPRATPAQKLAWCSKVRRTQGPTGISEVDRTRTSTYINPRFPLDMHGFVDACGEAFGVGTRGGTVLAVLQSIECWAGVKGHGENAACYNYNFGNHKLYPAQWHMDVTPQCWFLVDHIPSLDYYPSYNNPVEGLRDWGSTTFMNRRYTQYGTVEALRAGDIRAFCKAIGRGGYARSYASNPRNMDARAKLLAGLPPYGTRNGRPVIDGSQLVFNDSIS